MATIWFFVLTTYTLYTMTHSREIPDKQHCSSVSTCKCTTLNNAEIAADCSNLNLTRVPVFYPNVTWINISHNNIKLFPKHDELPSGLIYLDLSFNIIRKFHHSSLKGLQSLQQLCLKSNMLHLNKETYFPNLFEDLRSLKMLNLKDNVGKNTSGQVYADLVFGNLVSLEKLHIDGLENSAFGSGFATLKHLKHLDLSGRDGRCNLKIVPSNIFVNFPFLQVLEISACNIIRIENGTFRSLSYLRQLDISYNYDLTFAVSENVTYDLQFTDIRVLKYNKLYRTFGVGTRLLTKDIIYLQNTSLEEIYLNSNRLELIETGALAYAPKNMSVVSLGDNKLTMGLYFFETLYLKSLKVLDLTLQGNSHNALEIFADTPRGTCDRYIRRSCEDPYTAEHVLSEIYEINTKIGLDILDFLMLHLPVNLETILFNSSLARYNVPHLVFHPSNNVKYANFSGNILYSWTGPIKNLNKLRVLDLSNNYCSYVSPDFFSYFGSLEKLFISNNLLGFMLFKDETGETFSKLSQLQELDLSQNRITTLSPSIFLGLYNLEHLDLSGNLLRNWEFKLRHMRYLRYVDLSQNQLFSLPKRVMNDLDNISHDHNVIINLLENNLLCKCETLNFLQWAVETRNVVLVHFEQIQCLLSNGTTTTFQSLENVILNLKLECVSKIGLIVGVLISIIASITIIICGIVYRYRWKIRYLYYMARNKYSGYLKLPKGDDGYDYDAFVSFAEEDRSFVYNDLRNNLELCEERMTLCIHGRDFVPGVSIAANITNAINTSKKTIIVFSRNFMSSEWCMYEFNMARMESIYNREGRNVLFIIFYENIPANQLPMTLLELIESKSYIEYPNDPQGNIVFWSKIKEAIRSF